jgi:hypothetical protein
VAELGAVHSLVMATEKSVTKVCDVCGNRVVAPAEIFIGGHPHYGWFRVEKHGGRTDLESLRERSQWDVCGLGCLSRLANKIETGHPKIEEPLSRPLMKAFEDISKLKLKGFKYSRKRISKLRLKGNKEK